MNFGVKGYVFVKIIVKNLFYQLISTFILHRKMWNIAIIKTNMIQCIVEETLKHYVWYYVVSFKYMISYVIVIIEIWFEAFR